MLVEKWSFPMSKTALKNPPVPEFSRMAEVERLHPHYSLVASEAECAAIASRLKIPAVLELAAELDTRKMRGGRVEVEGQIKARVMQDCVVTLEPFEARLEVAVDECFIENLRHASDEVVTLEEDDPEAPEAIINGRVDLGEVVVQCLSLALDPYPRKPGVEFSGYQSE